MDARQGLVDKWAGWIGQDKVIAVVWQVVRERNAISRKNCVVGTEKLVDSIRLHDVSP